MHITIEDQIAEGDKVMRRWTWRFTHSVPFLGAAHRQAHSWTGISIYRLEGGKIVEGWRFIDNWLATAARQDRVSGNMPTGRCALAEPVTAGNLVWKRVG